MLELKNKYKEVKKFVEDFLYQYTNHIKDKALYEIIEKELGQIKNADDIKTTEDLFKSTCALMDLYESMNFMSANQSEIKDSVQSSPIYVTINIGEILIKLDRLIYDIYDYCKEFPGKGLLAKPTKITKDELDEIIPNSFNVFSKLNARFMLPSEDITTEKPKGKIVTIDIKNTVNKLYDSRPLISDTFLRKNFPNVNYGMGLNKDLVDRFNSELELKGTDKNDYMRELKDSDQIFQLIGTKDGKEYFRKLEEFPKVDFTRNYEMQALNLFQVNLENKRLLMFKREEKKKKIGKLNMTVVGEISSNYKNRSSISGAIYDAVVGKSTTNLTDSELMNLIGVAFEFESNLESIRSDPHYFKRIKNFSNLSKI